MQTTFALAALAVGAYAAPQIAARQGCATSVSGQFEITVVNATMKRDLATRQSTCGQAGYLTLTLQDGTLKDTQGRIGYIASNYQFQFDLQAQPGSQSSGGYSVCSNGSLSLAGSSVFYECLSGSFYNLYDRSWAPQCEPILIDTLPCGSSSGVGQQGDGQPTGTSVAPVGQSTDGQPTGTSVAPFPVTQITDGQPQAPTAVPVSEYTDGQPQVISMMPAPVSQISDGQPQAPTATPAPVSQISDGQPQAPSATPAPVSQISDGQPQAPTATGAPVTQISDGQPQAPTSAPNATVPAVTTPTQLSANGAGVAQLSTFAVVAGFAALFLL